MKRTNYFLVGMPSSGKSTIGRHLARETGLVFIDLDEVIVTEEGMPITDIFTTKGEKYFRERERVNLVRQMEENIGFVMATGGGAPCFYDNMDLMNNSGITIFLNVGIDDLFEKLSKKGTQKRPLLKDMSKDELYKELNEKLSNRKKFYSQAKICLIQNFNTITDRVNSVIDAINELEEKTDRKSNI